MNYVDILIDEVIDHEEFIINETKKPLKPISKKLFNNIWCNEVDLNNDKFFLDIAKEILNYKDEATNEHIYEKYYNIDLPDIIINNREKKN